jgi:hypothetical protein
MTSHLRKYQELRIIKLEARISEKALKGGYMLRWRKTTFRPIEKSVSDYGMLQFSN